MQRNKANFRFQVLSCFMANFDERDSTKKFHAEFDQAEQQFQLQIAITLKRYENEYVLIYPI